MTRVSARPRTAAAALALGVTLALMGCSAGASDDSATPGEDASTAPAVTGDVVVLAAASLEDTFSELADQFEADHPGTTVTLSVGASSALAQQVLAGSPADVLATASTTTMDQVGDLAVDPLVFAANTLQLAVPAGNPGDVHELADLTDPDRTIALCAVEVPCGAAAQAMFDAAGLVPAPDTYEKDVTATLTKVVLGEVDAAVVYRTDVQSAGDDVEGIDVPADVDVRNDYPVSVLSTATNPTAAQAFVDLVLSSVGADVLSQAGFVVDR